MAITTVLKCMSILFAAISVFHFSRIGFAYYLKRFVAYSSVRSSGAGIFHTMCRNSLTLLGGLIRRILNFKQVSDVTNFISISKGAKIGTWQASEIVAGCLIVSIVIGALAWLFSGSIVFGIIALICVPILSFVYAENKKSSAEVSIREQIPEALRCMSSCSKSGLSLLQTFEYVQRETSGALKQSFEACAKRLKMGETVLEALDVLKSFKNIPELKFVCIAISIQHTTGGSLSVILEDARASVMQEIDLLRNLRVQTSQARLSASIVSVMPIILIGLFSFISPDFLSPFFSSVAGMGLLFLALFMQVTGVVIVRKILNVKGGGE